MIQSYFNEDLQILKTTFSGNITAADITEYLIEFKDNNAYPRKLRIITDTKGAIFNFSFKDLKTFNREKNKSLKNYNIVISAIIINSPAAAALSTLYGAIANNKKYKFKVFSTHEAALMWVESFNFNLVN